MGKTLAELKADIIRFRPTHNPQSDENSGICLMCEFRQPFTLPVAGKVKPSQCCECQRMSVMPIKNMFTSACIQFKSMWISAHSRERGPRLRGLKQELEEIGVVEVYDNIFRPINYQSEKWRARDKELTAEWERKHPRKVEG